MNTGFLNMKYDNIAIFLHVDTFLPKNYDLLILNKMKDVDFCYFKLKFNHKHRMFRIIENEVNNIRNFPYGDQCFCVKYNYHKKYNLFDDIPFLEDYTYILKIPKKDRKNYINSYIITSSRRYKNEKGYSYKSIFNNILNNKKIIKLYHKNYDINELEKYIIKITY